VIHADPTFDAPTRAFVRAVALKYVRSAEDADDVSQDALLLAHRHRASYRGQARYSTWLYRVTATAALMFLRRQRRLARELPSSGAVDDDGTPWLDRLADPHDEPAAHAARHDLAAVAAIVEDLGARYPAVFWRRYGEGYTEAQIAAELGLSVAAVKARAHRGRQAVLRAVAG
jgi:RNA polymerase sigma-70 factor (ECF subfamily)